MLKRIMIMLLMAVAVIGLKAEEIAITNINDCKASSDYRTFLADDTKNVTVRPFGLMYADYLDNPDSFADYNALVEGIQKYIPEDKVKTDEQFYGLFYWCILGRANYGWNKYQKDAYAFMVENKHMGEQYINYLSSTNFCDANNISAEERLLGLTNALMSIKNTSHAKTVTLITRGLTAMNNIYYSVDDTTVVDCYKRLYRRFYPLMQTDSEQYATIVTGIVAVLKAYGVDVNKKD